MKNLFTLILFFAACTLVAQETDSAGNHYQDPYNPAFKKGEVLINFKEETKIVTLKSASGIVRTGIVVLDNILQKYQAKEMLKVVPNAQPLKSAQFITIAGERKKVPSLHNLYRIKVREGSDIREVVEELKKAGEVEFAEPNYLFYTQGSPVEVNDPLRPQQTYLDAIKAPNVWDRTTGTGQVIAIIDTGTDYNHPDLDGNVWVNTAELNGIAGVDDDSNGYVDDLHGWDFINHDNAPLDDNSHGTHVAGIACAEQNNSIGITGVAPGAKFMPIKVLQSSGVGSTSDIIEGVEYASRNGATVINMSFGSYTESLSLKAALERAYITSVLVAAAGNDDLFLKNERLLPEGNMFPACYQMVLGVMASKFGGSLAGFSNIDPSGPIDYWNPWGYNYELRAPGISLISCIPGGNYKSYSGTSMAAPIVAGAVAVHKAYHPTDFTDEIFAKLIFSAETNNSIIDVENTLDLDLSAIGPKLQYLKHTLIDETGDNDGRSDAGETITLFFEAKNIAGYADSCWAKVRFGEFEDHTVCEIIDSTNYLGNISTWATSKGDLSIDPNPVRILVNPNLVHFRDIVLEWEIGAKNWNQTIKKSFVIKIENGEELSGVMDTVLILKPDKLWLVNESFRVGYNGTLIIQPGTNLIIYPDNPIVVRGNIIAIGKPDSMITFSPLYSHQGGDMVIRIFPYCPRPSEFLYCQFSYFSGTPFYIERENYQTIIEWCSFIECNVPIIWSGKTFQNNYLKFNNDAKGTFLLQVDSMSFNTLSELSFDNYLTNCGQFNNICGIRGRIVNSGLNNSFCDLDKNALQVSHDYEELTKIESHYYGTTRTDIIEYYIWDFKDNPNLSRVIYNPVLSKPSKKNHGIVWKVELNEIDPQDEYLDPIGPERVKFDVYFNRPMDIAYPPTVGFGVNEPFLQRIVNEDASWSADSMIFTAYYTFTQKTGDGINTIKVMNARDTEGFEIPPEYTRFKFNIQAAGAASLAFMATPGIGKVSLEWPSAKTEDALGYNLYRYYNLTDSTFSQVVKINNELILDTAYIDMGVIPDTTYHYMYKIVGTDLTETDYSKSVEATPFNAANGDANGDMAVNVLDITTIVAYLLGNNPQPFLYDAANVNYDGSINVLDIVGVINLILHAKSAKVNGRMAGDARISIENGIVYVDTPAELAGLQFTLNNISGDTEVSVLDALAGFEIVRRLEGGKLTIIAFNLSNKTIGPGKLAILKLTRMDTKIIESILSSKEGKGLAVNIRETATLSPIAKLNESFSLGQNYPNPFTRRTVIPFELGMDVREAVLTVMDITGRNVKTWRLKNLDRGTHKVEWEDGNIPGMYVYKMHIEQDGQLSLQQVKRMIMR